MQRDTSPRLEPVSVDRPEDAASRRFQLVRATDIEPTPPRWLIRNLLEADTLALIFGDPGSGKSFLAVDIACTLASGQPYHGRAVQQGPVIYVAGEGLSGLARRRRAWSIRHGDDLHTAPLYVSTGPAAICDPESAAELEAAVSEVADEYGPPSLIVIDTLSRNFGGADENSTQDMAEAVRTMDQLRQVHRAAVLLVHHTGHADKTRARGSMVLKGALDAEYRCERDESGLIRLTPTKMKDAPEPAPLAFRLRAVELGMTDEDGEPVTSAVLDPTEYVEPPKRGSTGRGKNQTIALETLRRLHAEHAANVEADGRSPDEACVDRSTWQQACGDAGIPRQRFREVARSLERAGQIESEGIHVYPS